MKKVLIVGLGGSGGKTLSFIMDELKVILKDAGWDKDSLPECWKFVHIDVPAKADAVGSGLAESVEKQGGKYLGLANSSSYPDYDKVVFDDFSKSANGLSSYARWRPDPESPATNFDIEGGAGGFRGIGRVVTISQAEGIYNALSEVAKALFLPDASQDLDKLHALLKAGANEKSDAKPLVLLVSSMAGGSGASMVIDVADIIRGIFPTQLGGHFSAAFLYTADVFKPWPKVYKGAASGSLATLAELASAQADKNTMSLEHWQSILPKVSLPAGLAQGRGPGLVFPVGSETHGVPFGNSPEEVYRGFAKMLSPVFYNEDTQNDLHAYVQVNWPMNVQKNAVDQLKLFTNRSGASFKRPMLFATWGSSSLTMGRDRYKEYAAQRIGKEIANILEEGFLDGGDSKLSLEEAISKKASSLYKTFLDLADVGGDGSDEWKREGKLAISVIKGMNERDAWLRGMVEPARQAMVGTKSAIVAKIKNRMAQDSSDLDRRLSDFATKEVTAWLRSMTQRVDIAVLYALSHGGFETTKRVLEMFRAELLAVQSGLVANVGTMAKQTDEVMNNALVVSGKSSEVESPNSSWVKNLSEKYTSRIKSKLTEKTSSVLARVLDEYSNKLITEISRALEESKNRLHAELQSGEQGVTSAAYRDAPIITWPTGSSVPSHFSPTVNEVVLTPLELYDSAFTTQINTESGLTGKDSLRNIASLIIFRRLLLENGQTQSKVGLQSEFGSLHPSLETNSFTWKPPVLNNGSNYAPKYNFRFSGSDIRKIAVEYLGITGSSFERFSRKTIAEWIQDDPGNEDTFKSLLETSINYASPLVSIDSNAVSKFHGNGYQTIKYSFSSIPISRSSKSIQSIASGWGTGPSAADNTKSLEDACDSASSATEVFIRSESPPYSPWVFSSLTSPIKDRFAGLSKEEIAHNWMYVRSRPLRQFVPLGSDLVDAFLRGWIVGRISGLIQFESAAEGKPFKIHVHSADPSNSKVSVFGQVTLGADELNNEGQDTGQDSSGWNIPALLLESLPFALASASTNGEVLQPYLDLIELGSDLRKGPILRSSTDMNALDKWYSQEGGFPQSQLDFTDSESEDKLENVRDWLNATQEMLSEIDATAISRENFYTIDPVYEIATELADAIKVVLAELERPDLGSSNPGQKRYEAGGATIGDQTRIKRTQA